MGFGVALTLSAGRDGGNPNQGREGAAGIEGDVDRSILQTGSGVAWLSGIAAQVGGMPAGMQGAAEMLPAV